MKMDLSPGRRPRVVPTTIEGTVRRFIRLRHIVKEAEARIEELKPPIVAKLRRAPERRAEIAGHMLTLVHVERESVSLATLRKELPAPFLEAVEELVTVSESDQIRVS